MPSSRNTRPAPMLWLLALVLVLSGARFGLDLRNGLAFERGKMMFNDLIIFRASVHHYESMDRLYTTDKPNYFRPGSAVYKYPPPYASLLLQLPYENMALLVLLVGWAEAACYLAALILMYFTFRPPPARALVLLIILLNWVPFRESMQGPQLEPLLLLLLVMAAAELRRVSPSASSPRTFLAGIPVGVAGAFKVYPGFIGLFGLFLRGGRRFLLGAAAGAAATLAGSAILLGSTRPLVRYFTEVLPDLGGTLLRWDNISLPANLGRLFVLAARGPESAAAAARPLAPILEDTGQEAIRAAVIVSGLMIAGFLLWVSIRSYRSAEGRPARVNLGLGASVCLLLLFIPTSWADYQTLLALPLFVGVCHLPSPREDRLSLILITAAALAGLVPTGSEFLEERIHLTTALRSWMPLALWWGLVRLIRLESPESRGGGCRILRPRLPGPGS